LVIFKNQHSDAVMAAGLFEERAEASMDAAVATGMLPLTAEEVQADGGTIGGALQTAGAALAYFWHGG
jgi:hypothetical protein